MEKTQSTLNNTLCNKGDEGEEGSIRWGIRDGGNKKSLTMGDEGEKR